MPWQRTNKPELEFPGQRVNPCHINSQGSLHHATSLPPNTTAMQTGPTTTPLPAAPRPQNYVPDTVIVRKDDTKPGFHCFQKSSLIVFNEQATLGPELCFFPSTLSFSLRDERSCVINLTQSFTTG